MTAIILSKCNDEIKKSATEQFPNCSKEQLKENIKKLKRLKLIELGLANEGSTKINTSKLM